MLKLKMPGRTRANSVEERAIQIRKQYPAVDETYFQTIANTNPSLEAQIAMLQKKQDSLLLALKRNREDLKKTEGLCASDPADTNKTNDLAHYQEKISLLTEDFQALDKKLQSLRTESMAQLQASMPVAAKEQARTPSPEKEEQQEKIDPAPWQGELRETLQPQLRDIERLINYFKVLADLKGFVLALKLQLDQSEREINTVQTQETYENLRGVLSSSALLTRETINILTIAVENLARLQFETPEPSEDTAIVEKHQPITEQLQHCLQALATLNGEELMSQGDRKAAVQQRELPVIPEEVAKEPLSPEVKPMAVTEKPVTPEVKPMAVTEKPVTLAVKPSAAPEKQVSPPPVSRNAPPPPPPPPGLGLFNKAPAKTATTQVGTYTKTSAALKAALAAGKVKEKPQQMGLFAKDGVDPEALKRQRAAAAQKLQGVFAGAANDSAAEMTF